jgi:hypothetical protein
MTRVEQIAKAKAAYDRAVRLRKRKEASIILARLVSLKTRQLRAECKRAAR